MDSEYTKEGSLQYFEQVTCPNGDVYLCLKKTNKSKSLLHQLWNLRKDGESVTTKMKAKP